MSSLDPLARMDRILVSSDGSEFSEGAVRLAIAVGVKSGAKLFAMTMVKTNPEYETIAPQLVAQKAAESRAHLESVVARAKEAGIACEPILCHGDEPSRETIDAARKVNADLIVMGRRGRRGLARLMVGDATVKVIGKGPCSVLVVPQASQMWTSRILLATDGSRFSDAAAVTASMVAKCCHTAVSVVTALVPSHNEKRQQEGRDSVAKIVAYLRDQGIEAEGEALPGEPDQVIVEAAQRKAAGLIITGTHGRTGFDKVLVGSVSERVIGKTACPVLVVKA
ncbi:MAG: universal stress protein [Alphaproteobacteria bacterium]|nr:universal stress protein [Alphaproteobacteria bacterium]